MQDAYWKCESKDAHPREGGGAGKITSDPILNIWSKLGTCGREGFIYTPDTPRKKSEGKNISGGRGGRWVSEVSFIFFVAAFICFISP